MKTQTQTINGTGDNADEQNYWLNDGQSDEDESIRWFRQHSMRTSTSLDTVTVIDSIPKFAGTDDDNDGTEDEEDDFPTDEDEDTDTGSPMTVRGDNSDEDDDNQMVKVTIDATACGSDRTRLNAEQRTSLDTDDAELFEALDGVKIEDDDNDGTEDEEDDFPTDVQKTQTQ